MSHTCFGCKFKSLTLFACISNHFILAFRTSTLTRVWAEENRILLGGVGFWNKWRCEILRLVMSGMIDSAERVNQGGLLGRESMRVFFAAVEMDDARFE